MPFLEISSGFRINYRVAGDGFPLVLLHGWGMSSEIWRMQQDLGPDYQLIMPDLRGHGLSSAPAAGYCFDDFAHDLAELFTALKLEKAVVVGWSMGAQVLLQSIPLLKNRITGAVLVSATPRFTECEGYPHGLAGSAVKGLAALVRRDCRKAVAEFATGMFTADELQVAELQLKIPEQHVLLAALTTLAQSDLRPLLPTVDLPVLLVHGSADTICLPSASRYMLGKLPDARLKIMEGVGHAPFISRPDEFNALLRGFLESCQCI